MSDLLLAIGHHLLMFAIVTVLTVEILLVRPEMTSVQAARVARLDIAYGIVAGLILAAGLGRVFLGLKGWQFYLTNPFFWAKMAAFAGVAVLSAQPTRQFVGWRAAIRGDSDFSPPAEEIGRVRRFMHGEAAVLVLILIFAALMARYPF